VCDEPLPALDARRTPVPHSCEDCARLNAFLESPTERVGRFPLNEKRRFHLEAELRFSQADALWTTQRDASPYTLVVSKNDTSYRKRHGEWTKCVVHAELVLREAFDQATLRELLAEQFDDSMQMRMVRRALPPPVQGMAPESKRGPPTHLAQAHSKQSRHFD